MNILTVPGYGSTPWYASDWSALNYRSLEQPTSAGVQLGIVNDSSPHNYLGVKGVLRRVGGSCGEALGVHGGGVNILSFSPLAVTPTSPRHSHQRLSPRSKHKITIIIRVITTTRPTWSGSPPKNSMLSFTHVNARAWSLKPWWWLFMTVMIEDHDMMKI